MNRFGTTVGGLLALLAAPAMGATFNNTTGLASPGTTIGFDGLAPFTVISNTYAGLGVTITGLSASNAGTIGTAPGASNEVEEVRTTTFTFTFSSPVSEVAFEFATNRLGTSVTGKLDGAAVDSFQPGSFSAGSPAFYGFTGGRFDQVTVDLSGDATALIDNLQFSLAAPVTDVPEPASGAVLMAGLAGLVVVGARRRI